MPGDRPMPGDRSHRLRSAPWLIAGLAFVLLTASLIFASPRSTATRMGNELLQASSPESITGVPAEGEITRGPDGKFPTLINRPDGPPTIALTTTDPQGRTGNIACSTCHSVREPNFSNQTAADLDQFHQNMPIGHGNLTCYACHNPEDADTLRLADTTKVEFKNVMTLCSQCHAQQAKDYANGAHGGMNGYWDLTRGPRTRNNCIDCHDPHVPRYPKMKPTFKPKDRFLDPHTSEPARKGGVRSLQPENEVHSE